MSNSRHLAAKVLRGWWWVPVAAAIGALIVARASHHPWDTAARAAGYGLLVGLLAVVGVWLRGVRGAQQRSDRG
jgi:hypothetical protein